MKLVNETNIVVKNRQILITGAEGMIGSRIIRTLYSLGYNVTGLDRDHPGSTVPWKTIKADLVTESLTDKLKGFFFDIIVHCAASIPRDFSDSESVYQRNHQIDKNVIDYVKKNKTGIIFMSSTSLYGNSREEKKETDTIVPDNFYSQGKLETENEIAGLDVDVKVSLRINAPYDPNQKNNTVFKLFIEKALANEDLLYHGTGNREQDFTSASDIVNVVEKILKMERVAGIYNIAGGHPVSMKELAALIVRSVPGCRSRIKSSGITDPQEEYKARFSIEKARMELGWYPVCTLEEGIAGMINYLGK